MHGALLPVLASAALLLAAPAWAADIPGIVAVPGVPAGAGIESSGGGGVDCLAVIQPWSIWAPVGNSTAAQPTTSPVPPYVEASIDFYLENVGQSLIQAPYTVGIYNPHYTTVIQVWNFDFVNATQGQVYGNVTGGLETLEPSSGNSVYLGILLSAKQSDVTPKNITINGVQCTVQLQNNITDINTLPKMATVAGAPPTPAGESGAGIESAQQPVSISNGQIIGVDGTPTTFKAINYFGFNNGATMFDGLYAGSDSLSLDFAQVLLRIQALGFNTIRVPFSFVSLFSGQPVSYTNTCTPDTTSELISNLTPPGVAVPGNVQFPTQVYPENTPSTTCNGGLPNTSVYQRFLYVIQFLARNNFYILIDDHSEDPTVQNNSGQWVNYWVQLMTDIIKDGPSSMRVMVDPLNEPDHAGYTWTQMGPLYLQVMDAINAISPTTLFFIEGCGQLGLPGINWGDGFVTNPTYIQQYGLSDPNSFFQTLLGKSYLNNVGISPHIYPPSVTYASTGYEGASLWFRMYNSFGYLNTIGYGGHIFPVFIGETGSMFATSTDVQSMNDIAAYLRNDPNTGTNHNPITSVAYWDWNANSGDTGGIVDNSWVTILWVKINWLIDAINLSPWYLGGAGSTPTPVASPPPPVVHSPPPVASPPPPVVHSPPPVASPPPPVVHSPPPVASPPPPVVHSPPPVASSPPPAVHSPPPVVVSPSPPPPVVHSPPPAVHSPPPVAASPPPVVHSPPPRVASPPPPKPVASSPPPLPITGGSGPSPCVAFTQESSTWPSGTGSTSGSVNVFLNNTGSTTITAPFSLAVTGATYTGFQYSWNWAVSGVSGGVVSGSVNAGSWESLQPFGGNVVNVGFVVQSSSSDPASIVPSKIAINGIACQIVAAPSMNGR